jgi:long-chain acyl-CoA synthetase
LWASLCEKYIDYFDKVISLDSTSFFKEELLYKDFLALGEDALQKDAFEPVTILPGDTATIVYTSGTTTIPKGVELTQQNLFSMLQEGATRFRMNQSNRFLSVLPLAHILGRIMNLGMLLQGVSIYFLNDLTAILPVIKEVKPTHLVVVPRMLEKFYNTISERCKTGNFIKKKTGLWAFEYLNRFPGPSKNRFLDFLADRILGSKIRRLFGGHLQCFLSGSAKLDERLFNFFKNVGIPIAEGYGLTEACPAFSNTLEDNKMGTIGKPFSQMEIKISDEGEILLRGPTVMKGYYRNPGATAVAIKEGWLHTGDRGKLDEEGYLILQGRLSEKCKTSYGEFVDKPSLEELANQLPFVDFSTIICEDKPFVTCLLFPNYEALDNLKQQMDLRDLSYEEMLRMDLIHREIKRSLDAINLHLNPGERIRDYRFVFSKATVEGGELSPTLKARQKFIEQKYSDIINEMYPQSYWKT